MRLVSLTISALAICLTVATPAFAQDGGAAAAGALGMLGAGLGIGIAAVGGAMGQGRVISAAVDSIARNPGASGQMFLPWILGLVLIESLVIYAFVVALKLVGLI